jgi:hypothetical protein
VAVGVAIGLVVAGGVVLHAAMVRRRNTMNMILMFPDVVMGVNIVIFSLFVACSGTGTISMHLF